MFFPDKKRISARFFMTLFVNVARTALSFATGVIIARKLGPYEYGNFNFLFASFASITSLMDMGSSSAFYTFLSQKKQKKAFYLYYMLWLIIQFLFITLLISMIFPESWRREIWLGHSRGVIILAFIASFMMTKVWQTVIQIGESVRETVVVQKYNLFLALAYLFFVIILMQVRALQINRLFVLAIFIHLVFSFLLGYRLRKDLISTEERGVSQLLNDFVYYCKPLVICSVASFFYSFADTWFLQKFSGSTEQGFYAIALRFSAICLIVTSSILNVFWKEVAEAHKNNDAEKLYRLYTKTSQSLFFVGALMACFLIPFSQDLIHIFLGADYESAWPSLAIMFLYPVYQSLGQISGSYFYAVSETRLYSILGVAGQCASIPLTYLLLAPRSSLIPGLGLGSLGLSVKTVLYQVIMVNVMIYFVFKRSNWNRRFFAQPQIIISLLAIAAAVRLPLTLIFHPQRGAWACIGLMAASGATYLACAAVLLYFKPGLAGITKEEFSGYLRFFQRKTA